MRWLLVISNRIKMLALPERTDINGFILIVCSAGILALNGCVNLVVKPYGYVAPDVQKIQGNNGDLFIPFNAPSISQGYHPQPSSPSQMELSDAHEGIDIVGSRGTPVIAAAGGIVVSSYYQLSFGNRVVIDHGRNENDLYIRSRYYHLNKRLVSKGDIVVRGQQIGALGSTGILAGFLHLHYEIRSGVRKDQYQFEPVNPHSFWVDGVGVVTCFDPDREFPDISLKTTYPVPCREMK